MAGNYGDQSNVRRRRKARQKAVNAPGNNPGPMNASDRDERPPIGSPNPGFSAKTVDGRRRMK